MARLHYYKWLTNQEGQPISNADIYVYLAGTTSPITLYTSEIGSTIIGTGPQVTTNSLGYFEFWVGDSGDVNGHNRSQKFKIKWIRTGIEESYIDNISLFDTDISEVDETDIGTTGDSLYKNKLVSNYLSKQWSDSSTYIWAEKGVNNDITNMTGLDDGGIPLSKVANTYTDVDAKAAAVQSGAITNDVTLAPTHDSVYNAIATIPGTYSYTYTTDTSWTVVHNLGVYDVIVQCWSTDSSGSELLVPVSIIINSANQLTVSWGLSSVSGQVCVSACT